MAPIAVIRVQYIHRIIALNLFARNGSRKGVIPLLTLLYVFRLPARFTASLFGVIGLIKLRITHRPDTLGCHLNNLCSPPPRRRLK